MCYYVGKYFYVCQNIKAHSNKVKKLYVFKIKGRLDVVNCIEENQIWQKLGILKVAFTFFASNVGIFTYVKY